MTKPFITNDQMKAQMFQEDDRVPTVAEKRAQQLLSHELPKPLPPASAPSSQVAGKSLPTSSDGQPTY